MPKKIEISHKTIIFTVVFLLSLWFLFFIKDIIFAIFISILLMSIFNPLVTRFTSWKIPRFIAVLITYILVLGMFGFSIAWIIPPLIEQTTNFVNNIPVFLKNLGWTDFINSNILNSFMSQIGALPSQAVKFGVSVFSNIISILSVLVLSFYFLLYRSKLNDQLAFIFGEDRKAQVGKIIDEVEIKLGSWARGEIILMFFIGLLTYIGLLILGVPFALPLAIIAGILEIVPVLGPNIAAIPAVVIGLTISPLMALAVAALCFLVQQLENYLLVPKIMEKSVGVNPIVTLISLTIGYRMMGIVGIILSVPLFLTIKILLKEYFKGK
ncbi:AI-2E family transporter [Patescibacteria group bacterium]|nr:AI-2E family transporter [Patescibacteria group bacterium]MBU2036465.1 AI-2E family transporter [Patescibacteria group bacterium]